MNNSSTNDSENESKLVVNADAITVSLSVVMLLTILGNILVLFAFRAQPSLRKVKYYPIISLALADLFCSVTAIPLYMIKKNTNSGHIDARLVCDLYRFSYFFTEYASVMSLMAISIERFLTVKYPLKYMNSIRARVMICALIACWAEALCVSTMPFYWRNESDKECRNSPTSTWSIIAISVNVLTPFLIMLSSHCYIYYKTLSKFRHNKCIGNGHSVNSASNSSYRQRTVIARGEKWQMEKKATLSFSVVIGVFMLCWGPSTIYYLIENIYPKRNKGSFEHYEDVLGALMKILTFCNSFMNPVIYFWLNVEFRNAFMRVLKREWQVRSRSETSSSLHTMRSAGNPLQKHDVSYDGEF